MENPAPEQNSHGFWGTVYGIAKLWFGDPSTRFAKSFAIFGVALIAAPWWHPIIHQLAVKHLDVDPTLLQNADDTMFWSGWVLVALAVVLYIWVKRSS